MEEEKGFYKLEVGAKRSLVLFSTHLESKNFALDISLKDAYDYPVDGWIYFDSLNGACESFGVDPEEFREDLFPTEESF
jgi:hypothetical protein